MDVSDMRVYTIFVSKVFEFSCVTQVWHYADLGRRNRTYQTILFENVRALANFAGCKTKSLSFDVPPLAIRRNDASELRQQILLMTSEERKKRGINKSTLWYQKKRLAEGKSIKIYGKVLSRLE